MEMNVNLFGELIVEKQEVVTKQTKPSPFSFINNIQDKKYPQTLDGYVPYLMNLSMSQRKETVFLANELNKYHSLCEKAQFDFYYYSLPKRNLFAKWAKATKSEYTANVCEYFGCSEKEALSYLKVLTDQQIVEIVDWVAQSKGGKNPW